MKTEPIKLDGKVAAPKKVAAKPTPKKAAVPKPQPSLTTENSNNSLSSRSTSRLAGVDPQLISVTKLALKYSKVDFGITCGVRTSSEQRRLMSIGATQTYHSKHLTGDAVDVIAYVDGGYTYEPFELYITIAEAFFRAAKELDVKIMWGSCWLDETSKFPTAAEAIEAYKVTRKAQGRKPFLDGVHFEVWDGRTHY